MEGVFQKVRSLLFGTTPIEVYGGNKGGYAYLVFYDRSTNEVLHQFVTPPNTITRNVGGGVGLPISGLAANINYQSQETFGEPFAVVNKDAKSQIKYDDIMSKYNENQEERIQPVQRYELGHDQNFVTGRYVMPVAPQNLEKPVFDAHFDADNLDVRTIGSLKLFLQYAVETNWRNKTTYRASIFLHDAIRKEQKMRIGFNMEGFPDFNIGLSDGTGNVGTAIKEKDAVIWDGNVMKHEERYVDSSSVWSKMKSILSVPILDQSNIPLGALNIDTDKNFVEAKFNDDNLKSSLMVMARAIGGLLEGSSTR